MKKLKFLILFLFVLFNYGQDITNTLATGASYYIKNAGSTYFTLKQSNGHVGIGTNATNPRSSLEVGGTDGLLVTGTTNSGTVLALGSGSRMHYYPRKGAFRVGYAESSYWDDDGTSYPKLALYSIAMGYQPRATGVASTAIGAYNHATGDYALSLGSYSQATASHAVAIGTQAYATGIYSFAIGSGANTNGRDGSMVIGDDTYFQTAYASADNQLTMRFSGGYRFWSSYPDSVAGVYMRHGQSGWSNYSDRNKKENFRNVDGEWVLERIRGIPVSEWNYKKTDPKIRYIGPMAQDFYAAFHLGGDDSLGINTISIDGINMAGVQALEKRTREMQDIITSLRKEISVLLEENKKMQDNLSLINDLKDELTELKKLKFELIEHSKKQKADAEEKNIKMTRNEIKTGR